jgi:HTH-type transcriptional regulator/antitoxin HipB
MQALLEQIFMKMKEIRGERVVSVADIGGIIRRERKRQGVTQAVAAGLCGVSVHFLSNLERGKETSEFSAVLRVLTAMNIRLYVAAPGGES